MDENFPAEEAQENYGTFYDDSNYINKETNLYEENEENNENTQLPLEQNLNIFQNCSQSQMSQLNKIVKEMNSTKEEKIIVKAYRSKLKSKFYQIYEVISENLEKIKFKIFHKCNYPSCVRTFASAGWLRSHFQEHLKEMKKNKFNIMFENFMLSCNKNIFIN
jgi:hypothetical protein